MKLIMENWKRFLSEGASEPERAAALIWNDSTYRPLDDEGLSKIFSSESEIGQFISEVPQGHAGIVLIKEIKEFALEDSGSSSNNCL